MQFYEVGGCVRDRLLGQTPRDRDYVVIGETPETMLAQGFQQVGADFPVFLHPDTREEYALARTERKAGAGYHGFTVETQAVSLEEDLARRDLTINSMAMTPEGRVVDPYGGRRDLENRVLRHTSSAFAEDPVRVLRIARFLARYGDGWSIADDTWALMHDMRAAGELDHLVPERVWVEMQKGLEERRFPLMLAVLDRLKVFELAAFDDYRGAPARHHAALETACAESETSTLHARFALAFPREWSRLETRHTRVPTDVRDVTHTVEQLVREGVASFPSAPAARRLSWLTRMGVRQVGTRFERVRETLTYLLSAAARIALDEQAARLKALDHGAIAATCSTKSEIPQRIEAAQLACLDAA